MSTKKHALKTCTNYLNIGFLIRVWVEKATHGVETHWHSGKEKFQAQRSIKKDIFWQCLKT